MPAGGSAPCCHVVVGLSQGNRPTALKWSTEEACLVR